MKTGARISRRANEAKTRGLLTTTQTCRALGVTRAVLEEHASPEEWHHSGWDWKETNFYDTLESARELAEAGTTTKKIAALLHEEAVLLQEEAASLAEYEVWYEENRAHLLFFRALRDWKVEACKVAERLGKTLKAIGR